MKKLALVMIFALITTVFIALNYLLWDREKNKARIEDLNSSKAMSIDYLSEKIKSLDDDKKELQKKLDDANNALDKSHNTILSLQQDNSSMKSTITHRNEVIGKLKLQSDPKPFEAVIKKWADSIDKAKYDDAYQLQYGSQLTPFDTRPELEAFTAKFQNIVKSIKVKSVKPVDDSIVDEELVKIMFTVTLEVKLDEGTVSDMFIEGANEKIFTMDYDSYQDDWVIVNIAPAPQK